MVYPLVTNQKRHKNKSPAAIQNRAAFTSRGSFESPATSRSMETPCQHRTKTQREGSQNRAKSWNLLLYPQGDDLAVRSSAELTRLTSRFFFQNFRPRRRLRERDSLRPRSSFRGEFLLLPPSLSPLAIRETGSGEVSPFCGCLSPGMGGTGGIEGRSSCLGVGCRLSSFLGPLAGTVNGSSGEARLWCRGIASSSVGAREEGCVDGLYMVPVVAVAELVAWLRDEGMLLRAAEVFGPD